jgi:hypothetical protein
MEAVTRRQYVIQAHDNCATTTMTTTGILHSELGSRTMAWVSGRTTSVDNRESAASARAGLNNLISTCKTMLTSGYPTSA